MDVFTIFVVSWSEVPQKHHLSFARPMILRHAEAVLPAPPR